MKLEILGTRAKIKPSAPGYKKHTGFLIDNNILLDVGEKEYLQRNPKAIVFTHFHPDHAYFVMEEEAFSSDTPHYGPETHELAPDINIITEAREIKGYHFTPVPVIHALRLKSLGYIVEREGQKIFFTGDVAWIEKAHLNLVPEVDLVVTEATFLNKGGRINRQKNQIFGHTGIPDLIRILSPLTDKILFTHFGEWFYQDVTKGPEKIKQLSAEGVELIPGKDGMIVEI